MDTSTKETEKQCVLCCQEIDIFALGKCDHPVCYRCSTKMRVLCEQKYCAVCREELDKVVFAKKRENFASLPYQKFPCDKNHDIYFKDEQIYAQYRHLLLPECIHCAEPKVFSKFEELEQHMRKQHELFSCKLCSKHLKIFSYERKWYTRKELARHRTQGDPDDTSHRGHPLCKFCDERYLDNDELLKHLRRDHYFCHFCDADGSQEYYCDYQYLSEHFRESHYLCEEGRCATEQFTHAFRTEIDYKAHKAAAHSKNRAEARQNRQIDLQFNYAPRQQRRNEGQVTGEDYQELHHRGRGRPERQGAQKSWRYSREEEDRDVAAAMRASLAMRRQEERGAMKDRGASKVKERVEKTDPEELRSRTGPVNPTANTPPVKTMKSSNPEDEDDFPALGATAAVSIVKPVAAPTPVVTHSRLKEDDFPSLSVANVSAPMTPAYSAQPKKNSSFQEEDFPALVPKVRPLKVATGTKSAWSSQAAAPKAPAPATTKPAAVPPGPQLLSSTSLSSSKRKKKVGESGKAQVNWSPLNSDEECGGLTQQEFRAVPTMLDISSLLTVKGSSSNNKPQMPQTQKPQTQKLQTQKLQTQKPQTQKLQTQKLQTQKPQTQKPQTQKPQTQKPQTQKPQTQKLQTQKLPNLTTNMEPTSMPKENDKKKKQLKNSAVSSALAAGTENTLTESCPVGTIVQKENVPEKTRSKPGLANGYPDKSPSTNKKIAPVTTPNTDQLTEQEEEFPALTAQKPPPGFQTSFPIKTSNPPPATAAPTPPPGLASAAHKPPPGFTGVPLNSNVPEPSSYSTSVTSVSTGGYSVPEDFQQRNLDLILSIKKYLHNDESLFNQFKNYSAQFRQGVISATQYHRSCKDLLGEDFNRIFNELLVLLPDTSKQQELLTAHADSKALEKQTGKKNKNKKNVWQTPPTISNIAAELDCHICPTCRQVLAPKDFNPHKSQHSMESEEFPSLQSISRIIS
ncbi:E3 ubiquitin-protein ligase ZNF598 isoform X2 [Eucyclogobius newberryi]|uniref:E3 ubiquitin-protein ligase ZNF598 isoform X2 n=1 Tax=Eucyclogobius newberryi TaxID=166745 RepID=UPI003B59EEF1